ncbi:DNA excision repair protein ERCC-5 [Microplitis mediator]|uniref:DNA excision repair protein ERCC-5 n=1 Tax=Microplitis mediator TaxID=375433 RepID=UPI002552D4C9|nr:DNA excision repair protein ERCC-5 [Microplitis mediator]
MGVTGLWRLIEKSGKPVPLETLEGKILAIDISIWIHQALQGYQDRRGHAVPNAHLLLLYRRICKLLHYKIKPVFVFDGGVPLLKKNTIAARKKQKSLLAGKADKVKNDLLHNLMKVSLVKAVTSKEINDEDKSLSQGSSKQNKNINDMFMLPDLPDNSVENESSDSDSGNQLSPRKQARWKGNIHTVDISNDDFKALPADVRYDILSDLKETRKQNSWGRFKEIPKESQQFSSYQMMRLLKRRKVQESLEIAEKEMGGKTLTLDELEKLLTDQGVDTKSRDTAFRIASNSTTRLIYVNDLKSLKSSQETTVTDTQVSSQPGSLATDDDSKLSAVSQPGSSQTTDDDSKLLISEPGCSQTADDLKLSVIDEDPKILNDIDEYDLDDDWDSEVAVIDKPVESPGVKKYFGKPGNPVLAYMQAQWGLSQEKLLQFLEESKDKSNSPDLNNSNSSVKRKKLSCNKKLFGVRKKSRTDSESSFESVDSIKIEEVSKPETIDEEIAGSSADKIETISSSSDSDDFVEVQDVPIPQINKESKIQVTVKPIDQLDDEEDMFADVFKSEADNKPDLFVSKPDHVDLDLSTDNSFSNKSLDNSSASSLAPEQVSPLIKKSEAGGSTKVDVPVKEKLKAVDLEVNLEIEKIADKSPEKFISQVPEEKVASEEIESVENLPEPVAINEPTVPSDDEVQAQDLPEEILPVVQNKKPNKFEKMLSELESTKEELINKLSKKENLSDMKSQLDNENQELKNEIGKLERQSLEVTEQMRCDAQDLLRLFGIPYLVAPQEAEAQCAYLELLNLTDGTITDDSDIWLFGGRCVYKDFFNNQKEVYEYQSKDIEHHFKLSRKQMIQLAFLVGSDYTIGLSGVGTVTAMEILANFPAEGDDILRGLINFSAWLRGGKLRTEPGRVVLRNKLKNVVVDQGFPSQAVAQAYLFPTVDESKVPFSWGKPNLVLLADYTREKFGWSKFKFDETMGPVMKRLLENKSQKNIMAYFKVSTVPKSIEEKLSKRVQKAVRKMGTHDNADDPDDDQEVDQPTEEVVVKKRRVSKKKTKIPDIVDASAEGETREEKLKKIKENEKLQEVIPQREKDKAEALEKKLKAIEVFRKSRVGPGNSARQNSRRKKNMIKKDAGLSESSSDSN